jgi:site-specific DNA-methyltransferase (adenine-specific)
MRDRQRGHVPRAAGPRAALGPSNPEKTRSGHVEPLTLLAEADARRLLPALPGNSIDLILTDPPYVFRRGSYFRHWFEADLPDTAWPPIFVQLYRVLIRNAHAYVFCDPRTKPIFDAAATLAGFRVRPPLVWDKGTMGLGWTWRPQYEFIAWYSKGSRKGNRRDRGNVLHAPRVRGAYPTEKPVSIHGYRADER